MAGATCAKGSESPTPSTEELPHAQIPFAGLNGIQAALAVMERGLRPEIPQGTPAALAALICECWAALPASRPTFPDIASRLSLIAQHM